MAAADFYALQGGGADDNPATVAVGGPVLFPRTGSVVGTGITSTSSSTFQLSSIGTYRIDFQVSISEAGQLGLAIGGNLLTASVVGRATGTSQIVGTCLLTTVVVNEVVSVVNPSGNSTALTVTPLAGGANTVSAHLVIVRIA